MFMNKITLIGPFSFFNPSPTNEEIERGKNGIHLWCMKGHHGTYRVHYIGEASDVALRLINHKKLQLLGEYSAFDPEGLRANIKVLAHRPGRGMVQKYASHVPREFNRAYLSAITVFYAFLGSEADKTLRCRYEHALASAVEDLGQNILQVGHLRTFTGELSEVRIETPGVNIEALSNALLLV
jgi:hypothetical protein